MVIYKFFALGEYEEKEKWINMMSSKGYALKDFNFCKFYFEECKPNEYYYFLELLENLPCSLTHEDFLNYLEDEWNVEYICHHRNWIFFRRKKTLGRFSLFSNVQTKIYYFKKILTFRFFAVMTLISLAIFDILSSPKGSVDKTFSLLLILMATVTVTVSIPTFMKYRKLKKLDES